MNEYVFKLVESPNKKYLYDTNLHKIHMISDELYELLQNEEVENCTENTEILQMKQKGFFQPMRVKSLGNPLFSVADVYLERGLQKLTLQVTQDCNFRCTYCNYTSNDGCQRLHAQKNMDYNTAIKAVDFFFARSLDYKECFVAFYGGEPLLNLELIKNIIMYINMNYPYRNVRYTISTNASLLNEEVMEYMVANKFHILISFDGNKKIHDRNRKFKNSDKSTYDIVVKNLKMILQKFPDYVKNIMINTVVDPSDNPREISTVFENDDIVKKFISEQTVVDDSMKTEKNIFSEEFVMEYQYAYFRKLINSNEEGMDTRLIQKEFAIFEEEKRDMLENENILSEIQIPSGPCLPGRKRLLVDVDGTLFPCEKVTETSELMKIGTIYQGFDYEKIHGLYYISNVKKEKCMKCWAFRLCTICGNRIVDGEKFSEKRKEEECKNVLASREYWLKLIILQEERNKIYGEEDEKNSCLSL